MRVLEPEEEEEGAWLEVREADDPTPESGADLTGLTPPEGDTLPSPSFPDEGGATEMVGVVVSMGWLDSLGADWEVGAAACLLPPEPAPAEGYRMSRYLMELGCRGERRDLLVCAILF